MNKTALSVVINTLNEEKNIVDCINSIQDIADEIVVCDMESDDNTVTLAKKMGTRVVSIKRLGYVEPARNFAISKAIGQWVFVLDADERVQKSLKGKIRTIIKEDKYDVIQIPRKNIIFHKWIKHAFWWPDYQIRLFKKGKVIWQDIIHSQPLITGKLLTLKAQEKMAIEHLNIKWYKNANDFIEMIKVYAKHSDVNNSILNKKDLTPQELIHYMQGEFKSRFITNKGYLDHMHGFILSKFMEFYRFAEIVYIWERKGYPRLFSSSELKYAIGDLKQPDNQRTIIDENKHLKRKLLDIELSKFYQVWRFYCKYKDLIKRTLR